MNASCFLISRLSPSALLAALAFLALAPNIEAQPGAGPSPVRLDRGEEQIRVLVEDRAVLRYRYQKVPYKPYIDILTSPSGINILRDAPADHLHHHGIMYAVMVDGLNFWEESPAAGRQRHKGLRGFLGRSTGPSAFSAFIHDIDWMMLGETDPLLNEQRRIVWTQPSAFEVSFVEWRSELRLPEGAEPVSVSGSHYNGLGMRFVASMDKGGRFFTPQESAGTLFRGTEKLSEDLWCAYTAMADGHRVTSAMFAHPENRHPTTWFTMTAPFVYVSATHRLHEKPIRITSDQPLVERFGIAVWDGEVAPETVAALFSWWSESPMLFND